MKADGQQLAEITKLIEAGIIKPVIDKVFPYEQTNEALDYVETGKVKGKVVISLKKLAAFKKMSKNSFEVKKGFRWKAFFLYCKITNPFYASFFQ